MSREILQDIISDFSPDKFIRFFREKHRSFAPRQESFTHYNDEYFSDGIKLGEIKFSESEKLVVCAFKANQPLSERSGKKAQYEKGKKILKDSQSDVGIFIFYDRQCNFRFSLIYDIPKDRGRRDWSTFRRFTYFVSQEFTNKTFLQRIGDGDFSSLEKIKDAFSVEKVTSKFFDEFREIFEKTRQEFENKNKNSICLRLKDKLTDREYHEELNKFAFTFLGRIIFVYFLQRKRWIEDKNNFVGEYIGNKNNESLYSSFLQPLFFEVFAKKEKDRSPKIRQFYKNTPYLNGGLFEKSPLESEFPHIILSDNFLRNVVFDFFERYNFTIDENTPFDQEVSIDPEMLGKVFENTLAEEERGKKGTFYTPREIVHFMAKESLLQYLKNETSISPEKLRNFVFAEDDTNTKSLTKDELREIDHLLEDLKVLDPAVGSAAFPVEMMQVLVRLRKFLDVQVGRNISEVELKKRFIKNNLYGVDIDPGAIEIAKLRLWLALVVDYDKKEAEPLPNLDFQFRLGDSLQEKVGGIDIFSTSFKDELDLGWGSGIEKIKRDMIHIKDEFYNCEDEEEKKRLKKEFDKKEHEIIFARINDLNRQFREKAHKGQLADKESKRISEELERLRGKIKDGSYKLFKPDFHFSEVFDRKDKKGNRIGGFDIVIGNPPYGVKVDEDIKEYHQLGSRDSYGVFISTAIRRFLKPGGVLVYIVSDTWLTIKTHFELRNQVLERTLNEVIRIHQDCFEAVVNACIFSLVNKPPEKNCLIAADLTNISTRENISELREKLYSLDKFIGQSTPIFAVYKYEQSLIRTNSNLSIFVGSPKLFALMNDTTCETVEKEIGDKEKKRVKVRQIPFNGKIVELVRFGDIAEVKQGLATGDNDRYLFQNPEARGSYRNIKEHKKFLLTENDLEKIVNNEELRLKVIEKGFHKSKSDKNFDEDLWFGGRYIIPYDKGGESDTDTGWLPNYYVPTDYYIGWSQEAVKRINTLTIRQRDGKGENRVCSRFQNIEYYFKRGISFSITGVYAPTFRINSIGVFDVKGSYIEPPLDVRICLGILSSRIMKLLSKLFIYCCVDMQVDAIKEIPFCLTENKRIVELVDRIIQKQQKDQRYDYMSHEQKEIDKLVYEMYGLNKDDIREVETWYARRYSKLAKFADIN